ncbi:hypothetical protein EZY14_009105 [Kordia sp. TARA_039_SRF]|nr:hypothetical protein EZY14_009105 [Kordia sp. TARA_039_SRF]
MLNNINRDELKSFLSDIETKTNYLSEDFKRKLKNGSVMFTPSSLMIRKEVSAGGKVNLLEEQTKKVQGINSFDGDMLNKNRIFIGTHVVVKYAAEASGSNPSTLDYTTNLPKGLKSSNLKTVQGKRILTTLPIAAINDAAFTDELYFNLGNPIFFQDETLTEVEIEFPSTVDLAPGAGNSSYIEVSYLGFIAVV